MAKLSAVFGGDYLKAEDLQGKTVRVTIATAEVKQFKDSGSKVILTFQGKDKSLVCNQTNCSIIQENVGSDDTDDWIGRTIQLTVKKVEFQGKLVPAIRVLLDDQPQAPNPKPAPLPAHVEPDEPANTDDCPF